MIFPISKLNTAQVAAPLNYQPVFDYNEFRSQLKLTFFRPLPPPGFCALGLVVAESIEKIPTGFLCVHK